MTVKEIAQEVIHQHPKYITPSIIEGVIETAYGPNPSDKLVLAVFQCILRITNEQNSQLKIKLTA